MPSGEYSTLTLRTKTYDRILKAVHKAKMKDRTMYTSEFVEMLLDLYEKKS
ncbi:MAG: hypothetical protein ACREBJ_11320 [Nitrosotalea sp.]